MDSSSSRPSELEVSLATQPVPIRRILTLEAGSLLTCASDVAEPFAVAVNGAHIGYGEVIVVNNRRTLRLTRVGDEAELRSA